MRRLFSRVTLLIFTFAALLVVLRAAGARATNPLADIFTEIALADGQKQVCWRGICPGLTPMEEGKAILDALLTYDRDNSTPNEHVCWGTSEESTAVCIAIEDGLIKGIELYYATHYIPQNQNRVTIRLGDLVTLWGTPTKISRPFCGSSEIVFSNNVVIQFLWQPYPDPNNDELWLVDPAIPQGAYIGISESTEEPYVRNTTTWRGFAMFKEFMPCGGD